MTGLNDKTLLQAWMEKNDAEAFAALVWRHSGMVAGTCRRILRNAADAEDVTQECFMALAGNRDPIRHSLGGWLHTVATRRSLNRVKSENRRKDRDERYAAQARPNAGESGTDWEKIRGLVDEAIAALPERLRYPVIAHFLEGQTHASIADSLGVSQPSVSRYIKKGVEQIRAALAARRVEISASSLAALMTANALVSAPQALAANLAKLALAGNEAIPSTVTASAATAIPNGAGYAGGLVLMNAKHVAVIVALLVAAAAGVFLLTRPDEIATDLENGLADSSGAGGTEAQEAGAIAFAESEPSDALGLAEDSAPVDYSDAFEITASSGDTSISPGDAGATPAPAPKELLSFEVAGIVVDEAARPIAGARVLLAESNRVRGQDAAPDSAAMRTTTNARGEFTFEGEALEGAYAVSATAEGYQTSGAQFGVTGSESPERMILILKEGLLLTGRVLTTASVPVTDATVRAFGFATTTQSGAFGGTLSSEIFANTDERGYFEMGFADLGATGFMVNSISHGVSSFTSVPVDETLYVELVIADPAALSGQIIWADGSPAPGLVVILGGRLTLTYSSGGPQGGGGMSLMVNGSEYQATTDEDGRYAIENIGTGQEYSATIQLADGTPRVGRQPVPELMPGESHTWDYAIQNEIRVFGHVYGEATGRPLGGGQIINLSGGKPANVADDGSYEMTLLNGAGSYRLYPTHGQQGGYTMSGGDNKYIVELELADGEEREVDLILFEVGAWEIAVVDQNGNPVEGASVVIHSMDSDGGRRRDYSVERSDGAGIIRSLSIRPEAPTWAIVTHPAFLSGESDFVIAGMEEGTLESTVVLYETGGVYGVLADVDGEALPNTGIRLRATYNDGRQNSWPIVTDANGGFLLEHTIPALSAELSIMQFDMRPVGGISGSGFSGGGGGGGGGPIPTWRSGTLAGTPGFAIDLGIVRLDPENAPDTAGPAQGGTREETIIIRREVRQE